MFGFKTIVVGNMPNTKLAAAITAAKEQDGDKIDHTEIIRVHEWAWLGDWIAQLLPIKELLENLEGAERHAKYDEFEAGFPTIRWDRYEGSPEVSIIDGAEQSGKFFLEISYALEDELTRDHLAMAAAQSVVDFGDDHFVLLYGVVLTEKTFAKANSRLMLDKLASQQSEMGTYGMFKIRVFVVKDDGSVEMHKL